MRRDQLKLKRKLWRACCSRSGTRRRFCLAVVGLAVVLVPTHHVVGEYNGSHAGKSRTAHLSVLSCTAFFEVRADRVRQRNY